MNMSLVNLYKLYYALRFLEQLFVFVRVRQLIGIKISNYTRRAVPLRRR